MTCPRTVDESREPYYDGQGTKQNPPGVKRPGREADHSPPTSAEVKKMWIYNPLPHAP
jgi:hypothetical protein